MIKFGKGVVKHRVLILIIAVALMIPSVFGILKTRINYDMLTYLPDDIETMEAMKQRASLFLDFIRMHYSGQTVLAVGHGIINKAIQSVFYDKPANQIVPMKNAEVRCLELT